jgi:pimeloyl-ACP methyl ester carboxylesterase
VAAAAPPSISVDAIVPSSLDRVPIHYNAVGQGVPAVVLIHCWMCDSGIWHNVLPELRRTHRVVTLDLPGHGRSGKDRKVWSIAALGEDVKTVVETLHLDHVILVGHSMGGPVMLEAARLMPGKVVGMVGVDTLLNADAKRDPKEIDAWLAKMKADFPGKLIIPCSAESELTLRRAGEKGLIRYVPGDPDFQITGEPNERQRAALEFIREHILRKYGSTGVQELINSAVFDLLKLIAVYPVEDENKFANHFGKVLPDAFLVPKGATALQMAEKIHTDLAKHFLYAVDARRKMRIGKEHVLNDGDVVKIVSSAR